MWFRPAGALHPHRTKLRVPPHVQFVMKENKAPSSLWQKFVRKQVVFATSAVQLQQWRGPLRCLVQHLLQFVCGACTGRRRRARARRWHSQTVSETKQYAQRVQGKSLGCQIRACRNYLKLKRIQDSRRIVILPIERYRSLDSMVVDHSPIVTLIYIPAIEISCTIQ
jgi:hypothetical protein